MSDDEAAKQINQCLSLLKDIFGNNLLGVYLYGSSILGGLQKYSDIDLFVVLDRYTTLDEKSKLSSRLLQVSGIYMKSSKLAIEMTIVVKSEINPWQYPPSFDFQYGDWLRTQFESGMIEPWQTKVMPDLALLITQIFLASKTLLGSPPDQLLCHVPYRDFMRALIQTSKDLIENINSDTRNVILTYARIWCTVETYTICSKLIAADWAISRLPETYQPVMKRAKAIYTGEVNEYWTDILTLVKPCADFMVSMINNKISLIDLFDNTKSITLFNQQFLTQLDEETKNA